MPCHGEAITKALLRYNIERFFRSEKQRATFKRWLVEQGIPAKSWYRTEAEDGSYTAWSLGINSMYNGLAFVGTGVEIRDMGTGQYEGRYKDITDRAQALALAYIGQQIQAQIVEVCKALNLNPRDPKVSKNGTLEIRIDLAAPAPVPGISLYKETARLQVGLDGSMTAITEEGGFDAGRKKLEALFAVLKGQGVDITPSGQYETHKHNRTRQQVQQRNRKRL